MGDKGQVRFIVYIHSQDLSMTNFSLVNVVFDLQTPKFIDVGFLDGTNSTRRVDFENLEKMIKREIFAGYRLPNDLEEFCKLIPHMGYYRFEEALRRRTRDYRYR